MCPGASGLVPWEGGLPQVEEHQPVALDTCSYQTCRYLEGGDTGHGYTAESVVQQQRPYRAQNWAGHRICGRKTDGNTPPPPHLATCLELDLWVPSLVRLIICYVTRPTAVPLYAFSPHLWPQDQYLLMAILCL